MSSDLRTVSSMHWRTRTPMTAAAVDLRKAAKSENDLAVARLLEAITTRLESLWDIDPVNGEPLGRNSRPHECTCRRCRKHREKTGF